MRRNLLLSLHPFVYMYVYVYIYMFVCVCVCVCVFVWFYMHYAIYGERRFHCFDSFEFILLSILSPAMVI